MGGKQSRFSRLRLQGEGPEEQGGETSDRSRNYLNYEELKKIFEEASHKTVEVYISLEESGEPLKDVVLDTTLRGLFYDTTEPGGDANLATHFLLKKADEETGTLTFSGYLSSVVIPYTRLWVSEKALESKQYDMQFRATDDPATMYFQNKQDTDLWAIYTTRCKNEEARSTEGGETEEETAGKTVEEEKKTTVALLPESVSGIPPRTNTIQAREHEEEFIYNIKFSLVIDKPQVTRRQSKKAPAEGAQAPKTPTIPQEPGEEEEKEQGEEEEKEQGEEEKEPGENEEETLQPRDDPKEVED